MIYLSQLDDAVENGHLVKTSSQITKKIS